MGNRVKPVCRLPVGLVLASLAACQSTRESNTPGALPSARTDVTPRLNASTYVAHGHLLERQGNLEQAAAQYRQALELVPGLVAAHNRLGIVLNKLGRHAEASSEFRAALAHAPTAAYLHNNLGFSLCLEGKYLEAEAALARAVELEPTFRRAQMNRGLVLAKLGQYEPALAAFRLAGTEADAYYNLAVVQSEAGQYALAARSLEQALATNPDFVEARRQLREVARLAAEFESAPAPSNAPPSVAARQASQELPTRAETGCEATLVMAASPEPVPEVQESVDPEVDRLNRMAAEIEALLRAIRPPPAELAALPEPLARLFDDLATALLADASRYDDILCELRQTVGMPAE